MIEIEDHIINCLSSTIYVFLAAVQPSFSRSVFHAVIKLQTDHITNCTEYYNVTCISFFNLHTIILLRLKDAGLECNRRQVLLFYAILFCIIRSVYFLLLDTTCSVLNTYV